jgi:histidinol-phosphate phosphatase family protein
VPVAERGPVTRPAALLLDRDGTLTVDVPYNHDPALVRLVPDAADALARARRQGLRLGLVTNQSGVAKGLITGADLAAVHARLEELAGPFDVIVVCPHDAADGCGCRKPQPGLVLAAADALGVEPAACVVVGDAPSDVEAARRAGAHGILVGAEPPGDGARGDGGSLRRSRLADAVDLVLSWRSAP